MTTLDIIQPRVILEDPHNCTDMADALTVLGAVYDTLVRREDTGYSPSLALTWQVSGDAVHWRFNLRPGVRFHDGTPCDAQAVCATLARMARPDMGVTLGAPGVYAQYLQDAVFSAPDPLTVAITLAQPMADLLDILCYGYIAAPSVLDDPVARPCGTGPYRIVQVSADMITAEAQAGHFSHQPRYQTIRWRAEPEVDARQTAWEAGAAPIVNRLPQTGAPGPDEQDHLAPTVLIYLLNTADGPLRDPRLRRALNLVLDRIALVRDVLGGFGEPLYGPFSRQHAGYADTGRAGAGRNKPDLPAARALLAEAGYASGLTLKLDCPTALPDEAQALSAALSEQLGPLGIRFDTRVIPDREAYAHMVRRSEIRDLCVFDSSPLSTYRVLREKLDSRWQGSWWLGYQNPALEALIDQAAVTPDTVARHSIFRDCHALLQQDPAWLYCYCHTRRIGLRGGGDWRMPGDAVLDVRSVPAGLVAGDATNSKRNLT